MSTRQLRRILEKGGNKLELHGSSDESSDDDHSPEIPNQFNVLGRLQENEDERLDSENLDFLLHHEQDQEDENEGLESTEEWDLNILFHHNQKGKSSSQKSKEKKKKNRKNNNFSKREQVNVGFRLPKVGPTAPLRISPKYFNVVTESVRLSYGKRGLPCSVRSYLKRDPGGRSEAHLHRRTMLPLLEASLEWEIWDDSFSMEFLETRDGYLYFRYIYPSKYQNTGRICAEVRLRGDGLAVLPDVLREKGNCHYHLETLMHLSELFMNESGWSESSLRYIFRAVYALDCSLHPLFKPHRLRCRLSCTDANNAPFFGILFQYMKLLDTEGLPRTSLEVCKLLLSLDPIDRFGTLFQIDFFAVRAEEFNWLEEFVDRYESHTFCSTRTQDFEWCPRVYRGKNLLWLYPNISFSLVVSKFYTEPQKANELMRRALKLHPRVLRMLVPTIRSKENGREFDKILGHELFGGVGEEKPVWSYLNHLTDIYITRFSSVWKIPELLDLLKQSALELINEDSDDKDDDVDWTGVRMGAFTGFNINIWYSQLTVQDFSSFCIVKALE